MNIKIDLVISASHELLAALQAFTGKSVVQTTVWKEVADNGETEIKVPAETKTETKIKTIKATKKTEIAPGGPAPEKFVEHAVAQMKQTIEETKTDLTQEMIIADAVPKSKAGHKDKIKAKVTELGYESITDLEPKHFDEFYAFLQTIPKPA